MFKDIKAVIFDLDGTLVDSMWVWSRIDDEYLKSHGYTTPENLNVEINHLSFTQTAHYFKERFEISDSIETILETWNTMALNHYKKNVKLKPGVKEFLDKLKSNNISISLDESAIIDGANYFQIFFKIILPLLSPAIVTVLITKGVGIYNDFYTPFLYTPKADLLTLSTTLFKFKGPYGSHWEIISAGIIIIMIPTLIIFLTLQKQIYSGLVSGSVKE